MFPLKSAVSVQEIPSFFGYGTRQYQSAGSGSGIIVGENDSELLIATNNHVVSGATTLTVCFADGDVVGAEEETQAMASGDSSGNDVDVDNAVSAKIKGTDEENDLAVIAVEKSDIPEATMSKIKIAQLGSSDDLVVGEQVVAIGNALGYGQSVTSGWVSALNRSISTEEGETSGLIQTDAAINPGNSGGALLNMKGEVIGINAAKYADSQVEGMGYAIPISKAEPILEELMNRQTRDKVEDSSKVGYLGIKAADLTTEAIQMYNMPAGAFLTQVTEGGAADNAGIKKGDIIVKLDGQKVSGKDDLVSKLQYYESGETIEVVIARAESGEYKEQTVLGANILARLVSAFYNYCMNCYFVFHKEKKIQTAMQYFELAAFILVMNNIILEALTQIIHMPVYPAKILTECTLFLISWLVQNFLIFARDPGNRLMSGGRSRTW